MKKKQIKTFADVSTILKRKSDIEDKNGMKIGFDQFLTFKLSDVIQIIESKNYFYDPYHLDKNSPFFQMDSTITEEDI
jgi:poly(3-hydroxyalkanoate) synthetase